MASPNFVPGSEPPRSPSVVTGVQGVTNLVSGRIIAEIDEGIVFAEPKAAPLTTALVLASKGMKKVSQRKFDWIEQDSANRSGDVAATLTAGITTIDVGTGQGSRFSAGDTIRIAETGELARVTSVSTDQLTVVRGVGNSNSGTATTAATTVTRIANASEEGADVGTLKAVQEVIPYNYTQNVRNPFGWTYRQAASSLYGMSNPEKVKKEKLVEHKKEIDRMIMFGRRDNLTGAGGQEITFSGGFDYFITTNVWDLGGTVPTQMQIVDWLSYVMQYGPNGSNSGEASKIAICSKKWITYFESLGIDKVTYQVDLGEAFGESTLGFKVKMYSSSHGDIMLVPHPELNREFSDRMYIIDPDLIKLCYHQGGNGAPDGRTKLREGLGANGVTAETAEYYSDLGLEFKLEYAHGVVKGLGALL